MSSYSVFTAFRDRLQEWDATPVIYENETYEVPVGVNGERLPFVFVEIFGGTMQQVSVGAPGANSWVEVGVAFLHVMVPANSGSATAREHATALAHLFRERPMGEIFVRDLSFGAGEPGQDFPNYWSMAVRATWERADITQS